jgi:hypothetical protein
MVPEGSKTRSRSNSHFLFKNNVINNIADIKKNSIHSNTFAAIIYKDNNTSSQSISKSIVVIIIIINNNLINPGSPLQSPSQQSATSKMTTNACYSPSLRPFYKKKKSEIIQ